MDLGGSVSAPAHDLQVTQERVSELRTYHRNPRQGNTEVIKQSLTVNGMYRPVVVNAGTFTGRPREVLAGNHTLMAARDLGWESVAAVTVDVDEDQCARIVAADNRSADLAAYDERLLLELLNDLPDLDGTGYEPGDLTDLERLLSDGPDGAGGVGGTEARRTLAERFGVPPFTLLDARQGYWRERKNAWIALGLHSEVGRNVGMVGGFANASEVHAAMEGREHDGGGWKAGTSIFDPVLTELLVRWYSAPGHRVLDPFAGGSVRGLVAHRLGRTYTGIDLRPEQVAANDEQAHDWTMRSLLHDATRPRWIVGDARNIRDLLAGDSPCDLLLTCPPYYDLEVYGDDPADLSRATDYQAFLVEYRDCVAAATDRMAPDAFAAIVTGALRDKRGYVLDLPADTTRIMEDLGWRLYQDAVLATAPATAALRAGRQFSALRKLTRVHQMVGVYHRGNIETVRTWPPAEVGEDTGTEDGNDA